MFKSFLISTCMKLYTQLYDVISAYRVFLHLAILLGPDNLRASEPCEACEPCEPSENINF